MSVSKATDCVSELVTGTTHLLSGIATTHGLSIEELLHRALQQLPRFSVAELQDRNVIMKEIERIARRVKRIKRKHKNLFGTIGKPTDLRALSFTKVPKDLAAIVNRNFHYIGYDRSKSSYLGFFSDQEHDQRKLVSMITLSPFDLEHIRPFLPKGTCPEHVLVVSRIFAFDWAPRNCISFMMGRMFKWLRQNRPQTKVLLTYLNPNVCFSGTSYKASNWVLFGREPGLRYAYLDGQYITLRALREKFHTTDMTFLKRLLKNRLTFSLDLPAPFEIYIYFLDRQLKKSGHKPVEFQKQPPIA